MFVGGLTEGFRSGKVCTIVSADLELKLVEVIMHQCVGFHIHNFLDGMLVFCETMFIENIVEAFGVVEEPIGVGCNHIALFGLTIFLKKFVDDGNWWMSCLRGKTNT